MSYTTTTWLDTEEAKSITNFQKAVYILTTAVPKGKVITYGHIGLALYNKPVARSIGGALKRNCFAPIIPCHRVVQSSGKTYSIGGFHGHSQGKGIEDYQISKKLHLLREEGVYFTDKLELKDSDKVIWNLWDTNTINQARNILFSNKKDDIKKKVNEQYKIK